MFIPNLSEVNRKINPSIPKRTEKTLQKVQEEFVNGFTETFMCRINTKGYENNRSVLDACFQAIFEEEVEGILSSDKKITTSYYKEFNRQCAFAFQRRLDKERLRYGGYSVKQIVYDIRKAAEDLSGNKNQTYVTEPRYRLIPISNRICKKIGKIFYEDRNAQRIKYKKLLDESRYEPLNPIHNYRHPDPYLRSNADIQRICHMPIKENARYISFPVLEGSHISGDVIQEDNLRAISVPIVAGYGQAGGYSVNINAGPGTGKTYYIIKELSPVLGEICNCEVYITLPFRSQVAQTRQIYRCDVSFSEEGIQGMGSNPNIRAYVYDKAKDIPATSIDPETGIARPNIFIIDEAHSLVTEKYREKALKIVSRKAKEILSAGGVVIAMSASWEMIAGTIQYNSMAGYDLLCNVFRVSSTAPLNGHLKYPNYTYADVVKYGKDAGVEIVNSVPAKNIKVLYLNRGNDNISLTLVSTIIRQLQSGKRVLAEYNGIDVLMECSNILEELGYRTAVCSSDDKKFTPDNINKKNIYDNSVYNDIINEGSIDFGNVDVVLTTKLLENGTTIDRIEGEIDRSNISTIYAINKKNQLNLEVFEQFSGRLRFDHDDAILLMPRPETGNHKLKSEMNNHLQKNMNRIQNLSEMIIKGMISRSRLHNIDFNGLEDMPEGLDEVGAVDANTISNAVYKAVNEYYKALMYDRYMFEQAVKKRFSAKNVSFESTGEDVVGIARASKSVSEDAAKDIRNIIISTISDTNMRDIFTSGYNKNEPGTTPPLIKTMKKYSRKSYDKPVQATLSVALAMQDIVEMTDKLSDKWKGIPKADMDPQLMRENFGETLTSAILHTNKRQINTLMNASLADGFKYLSQYKALSDPIVRYALHYGDSDFDEKELLEECKRALPQMPKDLEEKIITLMGNLFRSEKKKRIDSLVYTCNMIKKVDIKFYAKMAEKTMSDIDQITLLYEFSSYSLNPNTIHAEDTASGATFNVVTSAEAYVAITDNDGRTYKGLSDFCGKRITKERAGKVYDIYIEYMRKNGFKFDSSKETGRLKILRLFASVFTFRQETSGGEVYIVLEKLRKERPRDYDQIIHLNFRSLTRERAA